jgi:hypothetical protein
MDFSSLVLLALEKKKAIEDYPLSAQSFQLKLFSSFRSSACTIKGLKKKQPKFPRATLISLAIA